MAITTKKIKKTPPIAVKTTKRVAKKIVPVENGGKREGSGRYKLIPNPQRKTVDLPKEVVDIILKIAPKTNVNKYARLAIYNQLVKDGHITKEKGKELSGYCKKD